MSNATDISGECEPNEAGWLWPVCDHKTWHWVAEEEADIPVWVMSFVPEKGVCVQAGGNCGFYVDAYASSFLQVHTFEPHALNFRCLVANVARSNAFFYRAALGQAAAQISLKADPTHLGGSQVDAGADGGIPVLALDYFELPRVDLVHFDIEGYELNALSGAELTIARCLPVIAIEINGRGEDFGHNYAKTMAFFEELGYRRAGQHRSEHVFLPLRKTPVG